MVESPARKKAAGFLGALCGRDGKDEASVRRGRRYASWRIMVAEENFEAVRNFLETQWILHRSYRRRETFFI